MSRRNPSSTTYAKRRAIRDKKAIARSRDKEWASRDFSEEDVERVNMRMNTMLEQSPVFRNDQD